MALLTPLEARDWIPTITSTGDDARLTSVIARAESAIAAFCLWPTTDAGIYSLESAAYTFYLDGSDPKWPGELLVPVRPLISVTSVFDDPDLLYPAADEVPAAERFVDLSAGRIILYPSSTHTYSTARRAIRVRVTAGYATAPEWLKTAIGEVVQANWNRRHTAGKMNTSQGGANQSLAAVVTHIPPSAVSLLQSAIIHENGFSGGQAVAVG